MTQFYIGTKQVLAWPHTKWRLINSNADCKITEEEARKHLAEMYGDEAAEDRIAALKSGQARTSSLADGGIYSEPGYAMRYPDGYESWSPKDVFEAAYLPMGEHNDGSRVTPEMVDDFIVGYEDTKMGASTTVVQATLRNGFTVLESSACVDPANYEHGVGVQICKERIRSQVWKLLGFLLQTARNGI